jgi:hypothetical protein
MYTFRLPLTTGGYQQHRAEIDRVASQIESELIEALYSVSLQGQRDGWGTNTKKWTDDGIKTCLRVLGQKNGHLVFPTWSGTGFKDQWLFDFIWAVADKNGKGELDWKTTRGLVLACESEWKPNTQSVLWDFYKLTFAVADLRLLIYTDRPRIDTVELCRKVCPASAGFRYLLVGFPGSDACNSAFRVDAWTE